MDNKKYRYVASDPDVRKAAYAIVDADGALVDAWTIDANDIEHSALMHATQIPKEVEDGYKYLIAVESQQYYKGDDPRMVKSLLQLARTCGISMTYLATMYRNHESLELILPRVWTKGRAKSVNQFWTVKNMGMTPVANTSKTYTYAKELLPKHSATRQKHILDAIGIANFIRERHQKQLRLDEFKKGMK